MHAEVLWVHCKSVEERRGRRNEHLEKRRAFKWAVRKARKSYENQKCIQSLKNWQSTLAGKWWKMVRRLNVVDSLGDRVDVGKVLMMKGWLERERKLCSMERSL